MVDEDNPLSFEKMGRLVELSLLERFTSEEKMDNYLKNSYVLSVYCKLGTLTDILNELSLMVNEMCDGFVAFEIMPNTKPLAPLYETTNVIQLFFENETDIPLLKLSDGRLEDFIE